MKTRLYYLHQPVAKRGLLNRLATEVRLARRSLNSRATLAGMHHDADHRRRVKARKARQRLGLSPLEMAQRQRASRRSAEARRRASGRPADVSPHYGDVTRLGASEGQRDRVRRVLLDNNADRARRKQRLVG